MIGKVGRASTIRSNNASAQDYSLVGSYKLISNTRKVVDTGEVFDTGTQPNGYIIYTPDNRMLVLIVSDKNDRPAPESFVGLTDEQCASLFRTMTSYGGTYEFDGQTVKHHVDISWNQAWTGTTQVREFTIVGDRLHIRSVPAKSFQDGRVISAALEWMRVPAH